MVGIYKVRKALKTFHLHLRICKNIINTRRIIPKVIGLPETASGLFKGILKRTANTSVHIRLSAVVHVAHDQYLADSAATMLAMTAKTALRWAVSHVYRTLVTLNPS